MSNLVQYNEAIIFVSSSITPCTSITMLYCGLSFSRSQPDFEGFLRALRFPPSSKLTPSLIQFDNSTLYWRVILDKYSIYYYYNCKDSRSCRLHPSFTSPVNILVFILALFVSLSVKCSEHHFSLFLSFLFTIMWDFLIFFSNTITMHGKQYLTLLSKWLVAHHAPVFIIFCCFFFLL